jgi:integrase
VGVYNRPGTDVIQIYWYDDRGRVQMSLRSVVGVPITDRALARDIVDAVYDAQQSKRAELQRARLERLGMLDAAPITFGDLVERYHTSADAAAWKDSHRKGQERFRDFWLEKLGRDTPARQVGVDEDRIELVANQAAEEHGWARGTRARYLTYLIAVLNFGRKKLGKLDERQTITGIRIPQWRGHRKDLTYSAEETDVLRPALREVDLRGYIVFEAYVQAGRRLNATRLLRADEVRFETVATKYGKVACAILSYPADTDKPTEKGSEAEPTDAVLFGETATALEDLLAKPAVQATGLLMPGGDLDARKPGAGPIRKEVLIRDILRAAEKQAGVAHVKGRGYHGGRRRFAGDVDDLEAASAQSNSTGQTITRYNPRELKKQAELAVRMDRERTKRRGRG